MNRILLSFLMLALLVSSATAISVTGHCYLYGQSNHAGIMVTFDGLESYYRDTTYTDASGYYEANVWPDDYDVHYTYPGYIGWYAFPSIYSPVVLPDLTLQPIPGTPISGPQSGVLHWENSYVVAGSIWIPEGDTLIIEPGVSIYFASGAYFNIFGTLIAQGTAYYDSIKFLPMPTQFPSYWGGLRFYDSASDSSKLEHCSLQGTARNQGGAINLYSTSPSIRHCSILNSATSANISYGSGIYLEHSEARISDCMFRGNCAPYGAAIYATFSNPVITDCEFTENYAQIAGAGLLLSNSNAQVISCHFNMNYSSGIESGNSNPVIADCAFYNNTCGIVLTNSLASITNCFFYGNSAGTGGGVSFIFNSDATMNNCDFVNNTASEQGGGVYIYEAHPTLTNCRFDGNMAGGYGGGIYVNPFSGLTIEDCTFERNSGNCGGGMMFAGNTPLSIADCDFAENEAGMGGGLFIQSGLHTLTDCRFTDNSATQQGGAIVVDSYSSPSFTDCEFTGNHSAMTGGAVHNKNYSDAAFNGCSFTSNSADSSGGAVQNTGFCALWLTECDFLDNSAGLWGGAVHDSSFSGFSLSRCLFTGNHAGDKGGAVSVVNDSIVVVNCTITDNSCDSLGGGFYFNRTNFALINNSIITDNSPFGFYHNLPSYGTTTIQYCDFYANDSADICFYPDIFAPTGLAIPNTVNHNGDSCDVYANIEGNPLFTDPACGVYTLTATSPCIDAGDPLSPFDPDSTIADMGTFPFNQPSAVENNPVPLIPEQYCLYPAYPNPFNSTTILRFDIPRAGNLILSIYDISGRMVRRVVDGYLTPGRYQYPIDGSGLASGLYFVRVQAEEYQALEKIVLLK